MVPRDPRLRDPRAPGGAHRALRRGPGARRHPPCLLDRHRVCGRVAPLPCREAAGARGAVPGSRQCASRRRRLCLVRSRISEERATTEGAGAGSGRRRASAAALPPRFLAAPGAPAPAPAHHHRTPQSPAYPPHLCLGALTLQAASAGVWGQTRRFERRSSTRPRPSEDPDPRPGKQKRCLAQPWCPAHFWGTGKWSRNGENHWLLDWERAFVGSRRWPWISHRPKSHSGLAV